MMIVLMSLFLMLPTLQAYEYAALCIPKTTDILTFYCDLHLLSAATARVEIQTSESTLSFTLAAKTLRVDRLNANFQPELGEGDRAIRVVSDVPLQVLIYKKALTNSQYTDGYMVPEKSQAGEEYFTTAFYDPAQPACATESSYRNHFYVISSFEDNTEVEISQQDGTVLDVVLSSFGSFTQWAEVFGDNLASGTHIQASKPVNVVSGNLCAINAGTGIGFPDMYASSPPPVSSLGTEYVAPWIEGGEGIETPGFSVSVIAADDDTTVTVQGNEQTLNRGETATFHFSPMASSVVVRCSNPCLAAQFSKSGSIDVTYGLFMRSLLPLDDSSTLAYFNTPTSLRSYYVTVVMEGEEPRDLYLNGDLVIVDPASWSFEDGYTTVVMEVDEGAYELEAEDGRPFATYLHGHLNFWAVGTGYTYLLMDEEK